MDLMRGTTSPYNTGMTKTCNMGLGMNGQKFFKLELHELLTTRDESCVAFFLIDIPCVISITYLLLC